MFIKLFCAQINPTSPSHFSLWVTLPPIEYMKHTRSWLIRWMSTLIHGLHQLAVGRGQQAPGPVMATSTWPEKWQLLKSGRTSSLSVFFQFGMLYQMGWRPKNHWIVSRMHMTTIWAKLARNIQVNFKLTRRWKFLLMLNPFYDIIVTLDYLTIKYN